MCCKTLSHLILHLNFFLLEHVYTQYQAENKKVSKLKATHLGNTSAMFHFHKTNTKAIGECIHDPSHRPFRFLTCKHYYLLIGYQPPHSPLCFRLAIKSENLLPQQLKLIWNLTSGRTTTQIFLISFVG